MRSHRSVRFSLLAASVIATGAAAQAPTPLPPDSAEAASNEAPQVSDAQLGLEARARLFEGLGISNLSVLVRQGVATVDGTVPSEDERERAEDLVRAVQGIDRVVNDLNVADPLTLALADESAAAADREQRDVENMIVDAITADAVLGSRRIEVVADGLTNTVTLTGTVTTEEEKERAGQIAVSTFPAGTVRNQLEVRQRL